MGLGKYLATGEGVDDYDEAKEKFNQALHEVNLLLARSGSKKRS